MVSFTLPLSRGLTARSALHLDPMTTFTPHQDSALKAVADWLKAKPGRGGTPFRPGLAFIQSATAFSAES